MSFCYPVLEIKPQYIIENLLVVRLTTFSALNLVTRGFHTRIIPSGAKPNRTSSENTILLRNSNVSSINCRQNLFRSRFLHTIRGFLQNLTVNRYLEREPEHKFFRLILFTCYTLTFVLQCSSYFMFTWVACRPSCLSYIKNIVYSVYEKHTCIAFCPYSVVAMYLFSL